MSDYGEALFNMLPEHSSLRNPNNPARVVLDRTIGEYLDNLDIGELYYNLFITNSKGKYLDLFGKDYDVFRKLGESDEDYYDRIIMEKNEHLTPKTLSILYNIILYVYIDNFSIPQNSLTSTNPHLSNQYMAIADKEIQEIVNKKFIVDGDVITWL